LPLELNNGSHSNAAAAAADDDDDDSMEIRVKRKRFLLTPTPTTETTTILDKPLSKLSISQGDHRKRTKTTTVTMTTNDQCIAENNELSSVMATENFRPSYLKVPDRIFKQMLSNAIENGSKIVQCLDIPEKLHFVRRVSEITNERYFKDLQRQLWQEYYNISSKDNNWELTITKGYAHQHNTCQMYKPRKSFIEQRRTKIAHELQQINNELKEYLIKLQHNIAQWQPSIDFEILSHAINEYVKNGQQRLKENFNYKKEMILLDWNDLHLITKFYGLKPNEELIQLAKSIWKVTADDLEIKERIEILQQRIYLKRLPTKTDQVINDLVHDNQIILSNPSLHPDQRAGFASRYSKTIIECKFNLMMLELDEFQTIMRCHHLTLNSLQEELSVLHKQNPNLHTNLLIDVIEERRQAMIKRFFRIRQYKLKTFFDEAPTVDNN
jgi:hypothetical protein